MEPWQQATFLVGVLLLILTVFRMGRRRRQARAAKALGAVTSAPTAPTSHNKPAREKGDGEQESIKAFDPREDGRVASRELNQVLVQLHEVSREIEGRLDTRVRYAQSLLGEAESVLGRLEKIVAEARSLDDRDPAAGAVSNETMARGAPRATSSADNVEVELGTGRSGPAIGSATRDPHEQAIVDLAEAGRTAQSIATELGRPIGEVKLVLSLYRAKKRNVS